MQPAQEDHLKDRYGWNIESGDWAIKEFSVDFDIDDPVVTMTRMAPLAEGMPQKLQPHPANPLLVVGSYNVDKSGPKSCIVSINYVSSTLSLPKLIPPGVIRRRWFFSANQEEVDQDINGMPIINSSGEYFETPISRTFNDLACQFTYRVVNYNPIFAASFMDKVNADMFLGFNPGIAKLVAFDGDESEAEDGYNWTVTIEIHFRPDGWARRILDQGYRENLGPAADGFPIIVNITDDDDNPIRSPQLLDGQGMKKIENAPATWLYFDVLNSANFNALNLY